MIQATNLVKHYGPHVAVDNVSFTIQKGEVIGFLGPNGAGKSTTMNILTGYLSSTDGVVTVDGMDIVEHPAEVKKKIGYLPENPPLYPEMTVREYLGFVGEIKKIPKNEFRTQITDIIDKTGVSEVRKRLLKNLSKGYKQRVGLAQALIGRPEILILDEPTAGLDPIQILEIRSLITELGKDHTVILSSHILPEVSAVCRRVLIMNAGTIVADDSPENLGKRLLGGSHLVVRLDSTRQKTEQAMAAVPGVSRLSFKEPVEAHTVELVIEAGHDRDIRRDVFRAAASAGLPILQMRSLDMSLEDIFLHLTTKEEGVEK